MIEEESDLRERFAQLRAEERRGVSRFDPTPRERKRPVMWRVIAGTVTLLLVVIISITVRPRPARFSRTDRAIVRSVAEWRPPTDFLLHTPGSEMLSTTPRIPDLKGIPQ